MWEYGQNYVKRNIKVSRGGYDFTQVEKERLRKIREKYPSRNIEVRRDRNNPIGIVSKAVCPEIELEVDITDYSVW